MKVFELVSAANAASTVTSIGVDKGDVDGYAVEVSFSSGTLNGTLTLEASISGNVYATISGSSQSVTSGAQHVYNVTDAKYKYFRLKWVPSSGTGTITAYASIPELLK